MTSYPAVARPGPGSSQDDAVPSATPSAPDNANPLRSGAETVSTVHLRNIPLLQGVDEHDLRQIDIALKIRSYEKGAHIIHKGSIGLHLVFVLTGRVQAVDFTEDGKEVGFSILEPGDYFGELSIIDGEPRSASVIAIERSSLAFLPKLQALSLIYNNPLVAERVIKRMAASIRSATTQQSILSIPRAFSRVYAVLERFTRESPGGLIVIERMPTQQEIAIMSNTSRETVSRSIRVLINEGAIERDRRRLIILRPDVFKRATEGKKFEASTRGGTGKIYRPL